MSKIGFVHRGGKHNFCHFLFCLCVLTNKVTNFVSCTLYIVQPIKMFNTNFLLLIYGYRQNCLMSCTPKVGNFERWYFGIWCFPTIRHNLHIFSSQKSLHPTPHQQKLRPHPHHQQQVVGGSPDPVKKLSSPRNSCWLVLRFGSQVWDCVESTV